MPAMLMTLFTARKKANHTLQAMRLQHLRLYTEARIPEPVNGGLQMKQRLIAVWSALQACSRPLSMRRLMNGLMNKK